MGTTRSSFERRRGHRVRAGSRHPRLVHGLRTGPTGSFTENAAAPPAAHTGLPPERSALSAVPGPTKGAGGAKVRSSRRGRRHRSTGAARGGHGPPRARIVGAVSRCRCAVSRCREPAHRPVSGGNWVVVRGAGLGSVTAVYFGNVAAIEVDCCVTGWVEGVGTSSRRGNCRRGSVGPPGRSKVSGGRPLFVRRLDHRRPC